MACEDFLTEQGAKDLKTNADTIMEVVVSASDFTAPAIDGNAKRTLTGIDNLATSQRASIDQYASDQRDQFDATFQAQFVYKRIGDWSLIVGQSVPEADKLNAWQFTDPTSGEKGYYGPIQSQTFPITAPVNPAIDDGWVLTDAATQHFVNSNFNKFGALLSFVDDVNLTVGMAARITDRADGIFDVVTGETPNGIDIIDATASGYQLKLRITGAIDFLALGGVADGVITYLSDGAIDTITGTDNTSALSAISRLARELGSIHVSINGTFKGQLVVNASNVTIDGAGVIASDGTGAFGTALTLDAPNGSVNFGPFGGEPWNFPAQIAPTVTIHKLISGATRGDDNVQIDTTSGLSVGQKGVLISGTFANSTAATNHIPQKFQFVKITAINPNNITISEKVYVDMPASTDTYFVQWDMLENVDISGVRFIKKNGSNYAHRVGGVWSGAIDVEVKAETANGALACCKSVDYNITATQGFNGISTARMSENITIDADIYVYRPASIGASESISCFHEENPRTITLKKLKATNGALIVGGTTEHTNVSGVVDVDGFDGRAIDLISIASGAVINLTGYAASDSPDYTVRSEFISGGDVRFDGVLNNDGGGDAWQHSVATSSSLPMLRVRANAPFETANYANSFRTDIDKDKRLTRDDLSPVGLASVSVVATVPTKDLSKGVIGNVTRDSIGRYTVALSGFSAGTEYAVQVSARGAFSAIWQKFSSQVEFNFEDNAGVNVDPTVFDITIYS